MRNNTAPILLILFALAAAAYSQQSEKDASKTGIEALPTVGITSSPQLSGKVTVHFYRYKQFMGEALEPAVYCDDKVIAKMDNGAYFRGLFEPGKHVFQSNDKQSGIELELKPSDE